MSDNFNIFNQEIMTQRLKLRKISMKDKDDMFEYTSDQNNTKYLHWSAHKSKEAVVRFIENTLNEYEVNEDRYTWGIELSNQKKIIGAISLFNISKLDKRAEVSYMINGNYSSRGYATEALNAVIEFVFNDLGFVRVEAKCTFDNKGSESVMKKVGMSYEGRLKFFWNIKNEHRDVYIYAITNNNK